MKHPELIPLERISDEFPVVIATPPPHRNKLEVDKAVLTNTLRTLKADDDATTIYFFRDEPIVAIAPKGNDHVEALTGQTHTKLEKEKRPPAVSYIPAAETVLMHIPYRDHETTTPTNTARTLSRKLRRAFASIPGAKYPHDESFKIEPLLGEWGPPGQNFFICFVTSLPVAIALTAIAKRSVYAANIEFHDIYSAMVSIAYAFSLFHDARTILNYRNGRIPPGHPFHKNAAILSQNVLRTVYPTTYVHEVLTPGLVYTLKSINVPDMLVARTDTNG